MEMPRAFSSGRRSASTPVSARTRAVLPWSICPATPTIMGRRSLRRERQAGEGGEERAFVGRREAAQVGQQPPLADAADHRLVAVAQGGGERFYRAFGRGGDRERSARQRGGGRRSRTNLAGALH